MDETSGVAAEWIPIERLRPWNRNPRKNDGAPVEAVARSIQVYGFGAPILARQADYRVISGHTRLKAAIQLGLTHVPVRLLDLTDVQADALALADNKLAELATWDDEELGRILSDLEAADVSIPVLGFTEADLSRVIADAADDSSPDVTMKATYELIVMCLDEADQTALLQRLIDEGRTVRAT